MQRCITNRQLKGLIVSWPKNLLEHAAKRFVIQQVRYEQRNYKGAKERSSFLHDV
jgi:hypothetical protein